MCDTCGCNITPGNEHLLKEHGHLHTTSAGTESVEVLKGLLDANDHLDLSKAKEVLRSGRVRLVTEQEMETLVVLVHQVECHS